MRARRRRFRGGGGGAATTELSRAQGRRLKHTTVALECGKLELGSVPGLPRAGRPSPWAVGDGGTPAGPRAAGLGCAGPARPAAEGGRLHRVLLVRY